MSGPGVYNEYESVAELYDHVEPYRTRADIDFYVEAARQSAGPVLEIGCGTGRVLIPAARAGASITGLDLSVQMLAVCRQRLAEEAADVQQRVALVAADMRDFNLPQTFGLATIPFRPFQHLTTVEDQLSCLASIRRHLSAEGLLILDLFNPSLDALVNRPEEQELDLEPESVMPDGRRLLRRYKVLSHDRFNQVHQIELIHYVRDHEGREERRVQSFAMRYLFRFEAEHLLVRAGFAVERVYAGFDKSAYGSAYPGELIFVARKAGNSPDV